MLLNIVSESLHCKVYNFNLRLIEARPFEEKMVPLKVHCDVGQLKQSMSSPFRQLCFFCKICFNLNFKITGSSKIIQSIEILCDNKLDFASSLPTTTVRC